jgi:hypothetical protein
MTMPANQAVMLNATMQSKIDDLQRRVALLEQYIQPMASGGVRIAAGTGGIHLDCTGGNIEIIGPMGVVIDGDAGVFINTDIGKVTVMAQRDVKLISNSGQIVMNQAATINPAVSP